MGPSSLLIAVIATASVLVSGASWPNALKRCSIGDPNMEKCLLKFTQLALPKIAKGMPGIGLKPLDPLLNASFEVLASRGPVILNVHADNVTISGPSKIQLKRVFYDRKTSTYGFEGLHKSIKLLGNYRLTGSIIGFPLDSAGILDFEMRGAYANHTVKLTKNMRGVSHGSVNYDMRTVAGMEVTLKDSRLGVQGSRVLTRVINDNWDLITPALWDPMAVAIHEMYTKALRPFTTKFSVNDFFPTSSTRKLDDTATVSPERHSYLISY